MYILKSLSNINKISVKIIVSDLFTSNIFYPSSEKVVFDLWNIKFNFFKKYKDNSIEVSSG